VNYTLIRVTPKPKQIARQSREVMARMFAMPTKKQKAEQDQSYRNMYGGYVNAFSMRLPITSKVMDGKHRTVIENNHLVYKPIFESAESHCLPRAYRFARAYNIRSLASTDSLTLQDDVYFSRNPGKKRGRHGFDNLYNYRNIVIDIDAHDIDIEQAVAIACMAARILKKEVDDHLFVNCEPNVILMTGRGLQVVWSIHPLDGRLESSREQYTKAAHLLCDFMTDWLAIHPELSALTVDRAASVNASGFVRMPGSYNVRVARVVGKNDALVEPFLPHYKTVHPVKGLIQTLEGSITPIVLSIDRSRKKKKSEGISEEVKEVIREIEKRANAEKEKDKKGKEESNIETDMSKSAHERRYDTTLKLLKKTHGNSIPVGMRDSAVFVLGTLALKFTTPEEVINKMETISNEMFERPFTRKDIENSLCSAIRRSKAGKEYKMTNDYICNMLGFEEFPRLLDFKRLYELRAKQKKQNAKKRTTMELLSLFLYNAGLTFAEIGEILGKTRQTVSKWVHIAQEKLLPSPNQYPTMLAAAQSVAAGGDLKGDYDEYDIQFTMESAEALTQADRYLEELTHAMGFSPVNRITNILRFPDANATEEENEATEAATLRLNGENIEIVRDLARKAYRALTHVVTNCFSVYWFEKYKVNITSRTLIPVDEQEELDFDALQQLYEEWQASKFAKAA